MKIDLAEKTGIMSNPVKNTPPQKYYPSTRIEDEDIPDNLIGKEIKVEVTVCITRKSTEVEQGKDKKDSYNLEFRKIDFGKSIKDKDIQDDISDAIEGMKESKSDEDKEELNDEDVE